VVSTSNTIVLGRSNGADGVRIPGTVAVSTLGLAGVTSLCRNGLNQISACSSSLRYKTNIRPFISGLEVVQRLRPITFDWKDGGTRDVGFGAEEVAKIEPLLTFRNADGEIEGVKYSQMTVVLVNAIKEQQLQSQQQQRQIQQQMAMILQQQRQITKLTRALNTNRRSRNR
jgi:hypothetical protein